MKQYSVIIGPQAEDDLERLGDYIAEHGSLDRAASYVRPVRLACQRLRHFPERGSRRDDRSPGLRTVGFERRVTIAFVIADPDVYVARILYGGRDLDTLLVDDPG